MWEKCVFWHIFSDVIRHHLDDFGDAISKFREKISYFALVPQLLYESRERYHIFPPCKFEFSLEKCLKNGERCQRT